MDKLKRYDKTTYHNMWVCVKSLEIVTPFKTLSEAKSVRDETVWKELSKMTLQDAAKVFLQTLTGHTKRAYGAAFRSIFKLFREFRIFSPEASLQTLAIANVEFLLDEIREKLRGSDATKQARAAAFISLTRYLQRATGGLIRAAQPNHEKTRPTFRQVRITAATQSLTKVQWTKFLSALKETSFRDYLVAKMILQGAKRVSEVLSARIEQINWNSLQITFKQLKSKEIEKFTIITYPKQFIDELKLYLGDKKEGLIFATRGEKPLTQSHMYRAFKNAGKKSGAPFTVHPHVLRASAITYLSMQGYSVDQIMKVSGHADAKLVRYYDKTPIENNPTKEVNLV